MLFLNLEIQGLWNDDLEIKVKINTMCSLFLFLK